MIFRLEIDILAVDYPALHISPFAPTPRHRQDLRQLNYQ